LELGQEEGGRKKTDLRRCKLNWGGTQKERQQDFDLEVPGRNWVNSLSGIIKKGMGKGSREICWATRFLSCLGDHLSRKGEKRRKNERHVM